MAHPLSLAWSIAALLLGAVPPSAELRIELRDSSGAAVEASGSLEHLLTGYRRSLQTTAQGACTIDQLPLGQYRLLIAKDGFATHTSVIDLSSPSSVTQTVTLAIGVPTYTIAVADVTPLAGANRRSTELPAPIQSAAAADIAASGALDLPDFLNRRLNNVFVNEIQGNPLQPDLNYRGYTASPLLGTPQGLSVYMDGVRLNQPFGDVVSWDLIPRIAISEVAVIPGSNPLFGLNSLGGSLTLQTKDGISNPGTSLQVSGGSFGRIAAELEHGGAAASGLNWFLASNLFFEDGWRESSPSNVRQFFGRLGYQRSRTTLGLTLAYANNSLTGNGLQEFRLLERDYASIYTKPDITANRAPFVNLTLRHSFSDRTTISANTYYRYIGTRTLNGDVNNDADDEDDYNGLLNTTAAQQRNYGVAAQVTHVTRTNQFTIGAAYDTSNTGFSQSSEFGNINPDRSVTGVGMFNDDAQVNLAGRTRSAGLFASDTLSLADRFHLTVSGRFNHTAINNSDLLITAGPGSLTGSHTFSRFNPSAGATYRFAGQVSLYASLTEGSRAPTSIELGCADPAIPCKLPNAMTADPPLRQVVTRTFEAGLRGRTERNLNWSAGYFRSANRDDILFVAATQTGYGYFKNFGKTLRQGFELSADARLARITIGGGYTFLDATFQNPEFVNGEANSSNDDGRITIEPGNRIPLIPAHLLKLYADYQPIPKLFVTAGLIAASSSYARGNENNAHAPDAPEFAGPGTAPGYGVANAGARYHIHPRLQLFIQLNNLFNRRYYTAAQLAPTFVQQSTFYAPGAPRSAWAGLRFSF